MARGDITKAAVLEALGLFDELGEPAFYERYGYGTAREYVILHDGKEYPSKAIYGVAYDKLHPDARSLRHGGLGGGMGTVVPELQELGYEILARTEDNATKRGGWIFQSNPGRYDIYAALEKYDKMTWTVNQHRRDIRAGDDIYIWASGPSGGVVGVGKILDDPAERNADDSHEDQGLWIEGQMPDNDGWEVALELAPVEPAILRSEVLSHPTLKDMMVLRAPQMTNYPLTPQEHAALRSLVAERENGGENGSLHALVAEWRASFGEPWPTRDAQRHLKMRERFEAMFAPERLNPESFDVALFRQFTVGNYGGPGPQSRLLAYLKETGEVGQRRLLASFDHLLHSEGPVEQRLDDVLDQPDWNVRGLGESLSVKALAVTDPKRFIPLFVYWSGGGHGKRDFMQLPVLQLSPFHETGLTRGQKAVRSNDVLRDVLEPYFGEDTYAMSWFLWWLDQRERRDVGNLESTAMQTTKAELSRLAQRLTLPRDWLEEVIDLIHDKNQVIFYGPPGTGKTYVARELQRFLAPDPLDRKTVQFHPSYSYEDFVEGYRPVGGSDGHPPSFQIQQGPLLELSERAEETEEPTVLLIDEINRGNLAKIFGELYYLLEYREPEDVITLQYSEGLAVLPKSLFIIGTMNTADRSIALIDAALRRRFHFVAFYPDEPPIQGLLRRWLRARHPDMTWVADIVDAANAKLDRHMQIGPSHFMREDLTTMWVRRTWKFTVLPYIEEQYFDDHDQLQQFDLDRLRNQPTSAPATGPPAQEGEIVDDDGDDHGVDAPHHQS